MITLVKRAVPGRSGIHGWGLMARENIAAGEIIDETPIRTIQRVPAELCGHVFHGSDGRKHLPCGDAILTNNGMDYSNAAAKLDLRRRMMTLVALRDIEEGDEITFDYDANAGPGNYR